MTVFSAQGETHGDRDRCDKIYIYEAYREPPARVGRRVGPTGHVTTIEESCAGINVCLSIFSLSVCLLSLKELWARGKPINIFKCS